MKYTHYVAYSHTLGVFLGQCLGLGFWSKLDSAGQDSAVTFATPTEFLDWAKTWNDPPPADTVIRAVECADPQFATSAECEQAGLPGWKP